MDSLDVFNFCDASCPQTYSARLFLCKGLLSFLFDKKGVSIMVLFFAPFGHLTGKKLLPCSKSIVLILRVSLAVSGCFLKPACCLCV